MSLKPSLFQAEQPQLTQPILVEEVFHPLDNFYGPPLNALQQVHVSPVLRTLHLDAVLQVRPHQCSAEEQDHLPCPGGHAAFDVAQDAIGFLGCKGTLLADAPPALCKYPQVLSSRAVLHPYIPNLYW